MPFVTLIPGVFCIFALLRGGTRGAFLTVVLPVLLLFPTNFYLRIKHLPSLDFVDAALLPLGIGMLLMDLRRWRFSRMDLYVILFVFTSGYSQYRTWGISGSILAIFVSGIEALIPYMAGKLLIEQPGMRVETVKRFVTLLTVASVIAMYEYFFKNNPYRYFWSHFYPGQWGGFGTQVRWGFGRLAGPYVQSELAGMILMAGLLLAIWLTRRNDQESESRKSFTTPIKRGNLILLVLVITLFMTQARGPWIGTIVALCIASIGRSKNPLRRSLLVFGLVLLVATPAYLASKVYVSGPRKDYGSEAETAQYRAELIDNYVPIAKEGGAWGWGQPFPMVGGQASIDNEFLFVWLVQGYIGLTALLLLFIEAAVVFFRLGLKAQSKRERHLVFSLLGILLGLAFTLSTVFLGAQSYMLLFLLLGWSQAIRPININERIYPEADTHQVLPELRTMTVYT